MKDDGGPAFPHLHETCQRVDKTEHHSGLSVRDYFAGQALANLCRDAAADYSTGACNHALAERAYTLADFMLFERDKLRDYHVAAEGSDERR